MTDDLDAEASPAWDAPRADGTVAVEGPCGAHAVFAPRPDCPDDTVVVGEVWRENVYRIRDWHIGQGDTVIDLGANIGAFTVLAAHLGANVYAVEPAWDNLAALAANVALNRQQDAVAAQAIAVGGVGAGGTGVLVPGDDPGPAHWRVRPDVGGNVPIVGFAELVSNAYAACHHPRIGDDIAVVKIDVEGAEWPLLNTASDDDLRGVRYLTMEWHAPVPDGALGALAQRLAEWAQVEMIGRPSAGGMLYATRYDAQPV